MIIGNVDAGSYMANGDAEFLQNFFIRGSFSLKGKHFFGPPIEGIFPSLETQKIKASKE
jgi:hypothetical protein